MTRDDDAIVIGASFAGLVVALELSGRVLVLDRDEVGRDDSPAGVAAAR